ncbi:MAG: hypothetical protein O3B41_06120 [Bacteroidetes bacterium]|nr:hypothetical protein [Bacteroidota bacterium]
MNYNCSHNQEDLVLRYYDELNESDRLAVDARLLVCESCKSAYESILSLSDVVPRQPTFTPDDASMDAIRNSISQRVLNARKPREAASYSLIPGFRRSFQWSLVAAMVLFSFFVGRLTFQSGNEGRLADNSEGLALEAPERISGIELDPSDGMVEIIYEKATQVEVSGVIRDSNVQALLRTALMDTENPASRLSAARVLSESNFESFKPDDALVSALQIVLETDPNQGIRLQTIKAMRSLFVVAPISEGLKKQLFGVLLNDPNSAVRIETLELLTQNERVTLEWKSILEAAQLDINPLIRNKAQNALNGLITSGRLEELK